MFLWRQQAVGLEDHSACTLLREVIGFQDSYPKQPFKLNLQRNFLYLKPQSYSPGKYLIPDFVVQLFFLFVSL